MSDLPSTGKLTLTRNLDFNNLEYLPPQKRDLHNAYPLKSFQKIHSLSVHF